MIGDWLGLGKLEPAHLLLLILGLPYVFIALGRLVPYRQVKDWKDLYFASEAARARAVDAMERGADAIEATNRVVQAALAPIEERAREQDR